MRMLNKSARNLPNVKALRTSYLNIRDLLGYDKVVMPLSSLDAIERFLAADTEVVEFDESGEEE